MADTTYYDMMKKRAERWKADGHTFPVASENWNGEATILTEGETEEGKHFFRLRTAQKNGWIAVTTYYEDGTVTETYEK